MWVSKFAEMVLAAYGRLHGCGPEGFRTRLQPQNRSKQPSGHAQRPCAVELAGLIPPRRHRETRERLHPAPFAPVNVPTMCWRHSDPSMGVAQRGSEPGPSIKITQNSTKQPSSQASEALCRGVGRSHSTQTPPGDPEMPSTCSIWVSKFDKIVLAASGPRHGCGPQGSRTRPQPQNGSKRSSEDAQRPCAVELT